MSLKMLVFGSQSDSVVKIQIIKIVPSSGDIYEVFFATKNVTPSWLLRFFN